MNKKIQNVLKILERKAGVHEGNKESSKEEALRRIGDK